MEFKPYKNLLAYARQKNLIEGIFGSFQAQTSKHKAIIREQETTRDSDWHTREILKPQDEIAKMKDEQWAFKAIFQKAIVRLGKIVEFQYKDEQLGSIDDLLIFLDRLYDEGILKVYASLLEHPFRLWTFVALNPGNDKIKVAKTVEDKIFSLLCLWYFGSRKLQLDAANNIWHTSARKLLNFFAADKNTAHWPDCKKCYDTLYRGFDTNAFYGRNVDQLTEQEKQSLVRSRFAAVFEAGLPPFPQPKGLSQEQSEAASVAEGNELEG